MAAISATLSQDPCLEVWSISGWVASARAFSGGNASVGFWGISAHTESELAALVEIGVPKDP